MSTTNEKSIRYETNQLTNRRFKSKTFIISVGQANKEYVVHESVLMKSPVFAAMCEGEFKEAYERRISLPADDPKDLAAIVEYLYMDNFSTVGNPEAGLDRKACALELASLYVTAEYYQMDALKKLTVEKFKGCTAGCTVAESLAIAESIYPSIPSTDQVYPSYIRSYVVDRMDLSKPGPPDAEVVDVLDQWVEKGGRLAVDINRACMTYWKKRGAAAIKRVDRSRELDEDRHSMYHWRCRKCHGSNDKTPAFPEFEDTEDRNAKEDAAHKEEPSQIPLQEC